MMTSAAPLPPARPFFLPVGSGQRFCLYHAPHPARRCRGTVLHVHPFAEEMNRSRRAAALQARSFAAMGFGVLQIDLLGCGDSSGLHDEASWDAWKQDLRMASDWLTQAGEQRGGQRILWGVRLGALLALDFARQAGTAFDTLLLWQPVLDGRTYLNQFLRLRLAADIAAPSSEKKISVNDLRALLAAGDSVEVAGYGLTSALTGPIDQLDAAVLDLPGPAIHWMEVVSDASAAPPMARRELAARWAGAGIDLHMHVVPCAAFWSIQENVGCQALIDACGRLFSEAEAPA